MDALIAIFGSFIKVKIMRLFLFNESTPFLAKEVAARTKSPLPAVRREMHALKKAGILWKRHVSKDIVSKHDKKIVSRKLTGDGYVLNNEFAYIEPLKSLLTITSIEADESLAKRFASVGKVKLVIVAGVFIQNWDSRVDLLIVGEELNLTKIENIIKGIEAEIGKEIAYSAFETPDFEYRLGIHDRLVRDILDYPHVTLLDRLGIEIK